MKKSEVKELFLSRGKIAEDIKETYFFDIRWYSNKLR